MTKITWLVTVLALSCVPVFANGQTEGGTTGASTARSGPSITVAYQQYGGGPQYETWFESLKKQYEAMYPDRTVVLEPIKASEIQYYTKLDLMQQSADTAPDVLVEDTFLVNSDASAGYLKSLNSDVSKWSDWKTSFYPAMQKAAGSTDGTVYGIPFNTDTRGIWYDKPMLQRLGYANSWQPKTWDDVLAVARKVKQQLPDVIPFWFYSGKPMGEESTMQGFEMLLYGTGNTLYDSSADKWVVQSPGFLDALKFVHTIFKKKLAESLQNALTPQSEVIATQQLMPKQKVAMLLSGGRVLSISSKSNHPGASWDFVKLACSKKSMLDIGLLLGNTTPRQDVAATSKYQNFAQGYLSRSASFDAFTHFRPAYAVYPTVSNDIQSAMESVMTGSATPEQAMMTFTQEVVNKVGQSGVEEKPLS